MNIIHSIDPSDLLGVKEIALLAKVSSAAVANWCTRFQDFPRPVAVLAAGPVFSGGEVRAWLKRRSAKGGTITANSTTCFVIGPIGDELAPIGDPERERYEEALETWAKVIEPACVELGLSPIRANHIAKAGEITEQVFRFLRDAEVVIADVTGGNANVMYELGLRHTRDKCTIQIGEYGKLPFDISTIRTLKFSRTPAGLVDGRKKLRELLAATLEGGADPVTPTRLLNTSALAETSIVRSNSNSGQSNEVEEPGVFELLAEMEAAIPELTSLALCSTQALMKMTALAEKGTAEARSAEVAKAGFAGRLELANRMAVDLTPIADELEALAEGYEKQVARIDAGMICLADLVDQDPSQREGITEFANIIKDFVGQVSYANEAQSGLATSLLVPGKFSKAMRVSTRRIADATRRAAKALERAEVWNARLQQIIRRADGRR